MGRSFDRRINYWRSYSKAKISQTNNRQPMKRIIITLIILLVLGFIILYAFNQKRSYTLVSHDVPSNQTNPSSNLSENETPAAW